jgi:hypothetical protein
VSCPICEKRKPERFCPAKAEKICAVCCGTEREVSIDCPPDCAYLVSAHRYEEQHPRTLPGSTPFPDVRMTSGIIHTQTQLLSAMTFTIAKFCAAQPTTTDADVFTVLQALAESYKTLAAGIVYEQPPGLGVSRDLYAALSVFLTETKGHAAQSSSGPVKDSEIFQLLVFLLRMGLMRANGRPRSRRFIEIVRGQFPGAAELKKEESRIIVP